MTEHAAGRGDGGGSTPQFSRRKTRIGLGFDPAGHVILDAPLNATLDELRAVVVEHERWLQAAPRISAE